MEGTDQAYDLLCANNLSKHPASDLLVPAGHDFIAWHKSDAKKQLAKDLKRNRDMIGSDLAMKCWQKTRGMSSITGATMIPIGVMILLYNRTFSEFPALWSADIAFKTESRLVDHPIVSCARDFLQTSMEEIVDPGQLAPMVLMLGKDMTELYRLKIADKFVDSDHK